MLGVPLLREGSPVGVIVLTRRRMQPFTEKQIELVSTFADQAVIAIENVRLFDDVQARTRELAQSVEELQALGESARRSTPPSISRLCCPRSSPRRSSFRAQTPAQSTFLRRRSSYSGYAPPVALAKT